MQRQLLGFAAVLLTCGAAPVATAQEPPLPDSTAPVALEGVTVSVLRTSIPLRLAPYSVSVVAGEQLSSAGKPGLALDEVFRAVPGIQIDNRYNYALGERISVRGFGARAQFGVRGIRVVVDGIPATYPDGQTSLSHVDLAFLSRAEVMRGPASSLYGGSSGGVLLLETYLPEPGEQLRQASLTAGSNELVRASAAIGGASDRSRYIVRLSHQGYGGEREYSDARLLRFHAASRFALPFGDLSLTATAVEYDAENPGSLSQALLEEDRTQAFANNVAQRTGEEGRQAQLGALLRAPLGAAEMELAVYGIAREVLNPIPASIIDLGRRVAGFRGIVRAGGGPGTLAAGIEAATQRDDRLNFANEAGRKGALTLDQDESVDDVALFAQATLRPLRPVTLLGGARYDWYRFFTDDHLVGGENPDESGSIRMSQASPSLGVSVEFAPALTAFANVATAFETPTTTELANRPDGAGGFNPDLRPQETVSYEAGFRGSSGAVMYELAAYTADVTNALIPFEVEGAPDRQFFRNAGSARHRGLEAGLGAMVQPWLWVRGAYTYTDARFEEYEVGGEAFDGKRVPGIAPHRLEGSVELSSRSGYLAMDARHASRTPVDDGNSAYSDAYTVLDARVGLRSVALGGMRLEPAVGVQNLLDAAYNGSVVVNAFGRRYYEPAPGRALSATLRVRF